MKLSGHIRTLRTLGFSYEFLYCIKQLTGAGEGSRICELLEEKESRYFAGLSYGEIKEELVRDFTERFGYEPDIDHPETYNEKIMWSKLNDRDPMRSLLSDKAAVRDWVIRKLGMKDKVQPLESFASYV